MTRIISHKKHKSTDKFPEVKNKKWKQKTPICLTHEMSGFPWLWLNWDEETDSNNDALTGREKCGGLLDET